MLAGVTEVWQVTFSSNLMVVTVISLRYVCPLFATRKMHHSTSSTAIECLIVAFATLRDVYWLCMIGVIDATYEFPPAIKECVIGIVQCSSHGIVPVSMRVFVRLDILNCI